jgi:hydrogenase maturation protease
LGGVVEGILILCTGYPYTCDTGFGYHVARMLKEMDLPENVECLEVGESASEFPHLIEGRDKMIVVDVFQTKDKPGTIVCFRPDQVPVTVNGVTDVGKYHLMETLEQISLSGKCPETLFIGVVPADVETISAELSPEIESKIPEVIDLIMEKIDSPHPWYNSG